MRYVFWSLSCAALFGVWLNIFTSSEAFYLNTEQNRCTDGLETLYVPTLIFI